MMFALFTLLLPSTSSAQIELDSNGRVGIGGATPSSTKQLLIESSLDYGLLVDRDGGSATYNYGLYARSQNGGTNKYGVAGVAADTGTKNIGLYGHASGATTNWGVYGYAATASGYAGYFQGNVYVTGSVTQSSDSRLKRDIQPIGAAIKNAVLSLSPRMYRFASTSELESAGIPDVELSMGVHYGVLAQDLLPTELSDLVSTVDLFGSNLDSDKPFSAYTVNYSELIPVLISIVQDQQESIDILTTALIDAGIDVPTGN